MVRLKFVIRQGFLALRISEGTERFYKSAMPYLLGNINLSRQWDDEKERFIRTSPYAKENNAALQEFKATFSKLLLKHPDFTARQISNYYIEQKDKARKEAIAAEKKLDIKIVTPMEYSNNVEKFLEKIIQREKVKTGCNFEVYAKALSKFRKIIPDFSSLKFTDLDYDRMIEIAGYIAQHKGYAGSAKAFRNLLGKASRDRDVKFHLYQIGDFRFQDYDPDKDELHDEKPDVLTPNQVRKFLSLDVGRITPTYHDRTQVELYYDFCIFMLNSFLAPCDVINLKRKNLSGRGTIITKRKKTHRQIELPVTPAMEEIVAKYEGQSKCGYLFPIMDDSKIKEYRTRDYQYTKFREYLNVWLKEIGKELGLSFDLYAYVFRHTAISLAIDDGLPISYVASVAGTSTDIIEQHYYNGNNEQNSQRLLSSFSKLSPR